MYGFKDRRLVTNVRVAAYLLATLFGLILLLLSETNAVRLTSESAITIGVALVGWVIAIDILFLQVKLSLRHKLEAEAIKDIQEAIKDFANKSAIVVTFNNDFIVKPTPIPRGFWFNKAQEKYQDIATETLKIRRAYGKIYVALESHEIAIIHLEHYYRYITIKIDEIIKKIDDANSKFLNSTGDYSLTEEQYKSAVKVFKNLMSDWSDVSSYLMDFRKILQNELLGSIFQRELLHRKPKKGYGTTLDKVANPKHVAKLVKEREDELLVDSNTTEGESL